jgi:hypothetical protein
MDDVVDYFSSETEFCAFDGAALTAITLSR